MIIFRKIAGTPIRFFGFLSAFLFLITASWRWMDGVFQGNTWYSNLSPICFFLSSVVLYKIAHKFHDLGSKKSFVVRLVGSPLKLIAFFLILLGTITLTYLIGYIHFESGFIWFILGGISLYGIDYYSSKTKKKMYLVVQFIFLGLVGVVFLLAYLRSTAKTDFITSNEKEFIVVYEMDGYPPLPSTFFWRKTIHIPENGLLITSSSALELPGYRKNYFNKKGNPISFNRIYNEEYCSDTKSTMSVDYYTAKIIAYHIPCDQSELQLIFQDLFESMCKGEIKSNYINTTLPKHRRESRDVWCLEFKKNMEIFKNE